MLGPARLTERMGKAVRRDMKLPDTVGAERMTVSCEEMNSEYSPLVLQTCRYNHNSHSSGRPFPFVELVTT